MTTIPPITKLAGVPTNPETKNSGSGGPSFSDLMKSQTTSFITGSRQVEGNIQTALTQGTMPIEELAPMMAQLSLEFEKKRALVSSLAGMVNKLMSTQI